MSLALGDVRVLADGLDHAEGVALGCDGALYAGGEAGQVYRVEPGGGAEQLMVLEGRFLLGVAVDAAGALYFCDLEGAEVVRCSPATGEVDVWCSAASGTALTCPNWAAFAPDGTLYVTDSGTEDAAVVDGTVVRVPPGGGDGERLELPLLNYPNGCALGADGTLFVLESFTPRLNAVRGGRLERVAELPGTVPDGLAPTAEGGLVIACFQPNQILYLPPGGGPPESVLADWTGQRVLTPTNVAFYGPELRSLAIATVCGWSLTAIDVPWAGQPLVAPRATAAA